MGQLIDYFESLNCGDIVDRNICTLITTALTPIVIPAEQPPMNEWEFASIKFIDLSAVFTPWNINSISYCYLKESDDFISGPFSGCIMATYKFNGKRYGVHVNVTGGSGDGVDQLDIWNNAKAEFDTITEFRPFSLFENDIEKLAPKIDLASERPLFYGIISPDGKCYTVCLAYDYSNPHRFIAIKQLVSQQL